MNKDKVVEAALKLYEALGKDETDEIKVFQDEIREAIEAEEPVFEPEVVEGLILLTPKAAEEMKDLITRGQEEEELPEGDLILRVAVRGGGCSGFSYQMGFQLKGEVTENDVICESEGVTIVVDNKSRIYLEGTTIDYIDGLQGKGFTFNNPRSSGSCGCGSSFSA